MRRAEVIVPANSLPVDPRHRDRLLQDYFPDRVADSRQEPDGRWLITVEPAATAEYYIDPLIDDGLQWWAEDTSIVEIPYGFRMLNGILVALSDAWTLLSWSRWLATLAGPPTKVTILHLDDHDDLMSPRLAQSVGGFTDLLTGAEVDLGRPNTVQDAITSGAIGMGSFIAPLVHLLPSVDILHLCDTHYARMRADEHWICRVNEIDTLLLPGAVRPALTLSPVAGRSVPSEGVAGKYRAGNNAAELFDSVADGPVLLHIDLDFFNNRFNGDSDWRHRANRHDPRIDQVNRRVDDILGALEKLRGRISDISIGISAGFFPAEYWQSVTELLVRELAVARD